MPRIDDLKVQEKVFKKKEYRSWDGNLLEKLKLADHANPISPQKTEPPDREPPINTESQRAETSQANENPNRVQLESKSSSIRVQQEFDQGSNEVHQGFTKSSTEVQLKSNKGSNIVQLDANSEVQLGFVTDRVMVQKLISKLGGNEKKIFFYVIHICSIKGSLSTGEILGEELTNAVSTTRNGRETAIKRLSKKGLLKREKGKTGANGTLCLHVNELIKTEALSYLSASASEQTLLSNWAANRVQINGANKVQLESGFPIYSSSINNINTTTKNDDLPENWLTINIEPLKDIGFSTTQLKQLYRLNITTPELIQESIYHFAFGLKNNPKFKEYSKDGKNPLNVLMGVLRRGESWEEPKYRSPQEIAMEKLIAKKKAERERIKQLEEEAYKLALEEWQVTLSQEQLEEIAPSKKSRGNLMPQHVKLSMYFREHIWPQKKGDYLPK